MEASPQTMVTVVEPAHGWEAPNLREVWGYRDLLYYLARRDVVVRYKQAFVGALWAIVQPLVLAAVFSVFLGLLAKVDSAPGIPYPLFAITGMVMWICFTNALQNCSESTLQSDALISKIYFPRLVIPIAAVVPAMVDFVFGFLVVVGAAIAYGFPPGPAILTVPLILALAIMTALGAGLWLSALNVKYRDVHLVVPLVILTGLFITPVIYPSTLVPENLQTLYSLNPMTGVLEAWRWAILGTEWPGLLLLVPIASSAILLVSGAYYFHRAERNFADVI
jgi:lipopolysaccharide transport system permease protein